MEIKSGCLFAALTDWCKIAKMVYSAIGCIDKMQCVCYSFGNANDSDCKKSASNWCAHRKHPGDRMI